MRLAIDACVSVHFVFFISITRCSLLMTLSPVITTCISITVNRGILLDDVVENILKFEEETGLREKG